jgi:glucose-1-phosphate cytidylyltransferase
MKVVIFCGGLGVRMGEETQRIPKPMIEIGGKPILWHIMRYYSMWGHKQFILALGYKAEVVKQYFLSYNGALFNDFVLDHSAGETTLEMLSRDLDEWQITFVDTGLTTTIGGRLKAVSAHLGEDETFLATYGDGLTDAPLDHMIRTFEESGKLGMFLSVHVPFNAHLVHADDDGIVTSVHEMARADIRMNGGFFVFKRNVVDYIGPGEELVDEPFARMIAAQELLAYRHDGFFLPMDTIKDRQTLESLNDSGDAPWRRLSSGIEADAGPVAD